jgi:SPP1 gp7 family putative phage head morphogenesis protein
MLSTWSKAWEHIQVEINRLNAKIARAQQLGQYSPAWAYQQDRLSAIDAVVVNQMQRLTAQAQDLITTNQSNAIAQGQLFAEQSVTAQLGGVSQMAAVNIAWGRLNPDAVKHMAGYLSDGSPLKALLDQIPQQTANAIHQALVDGIVQGRNPRVTARIIKREATVPLFRAERIARTETMRAYRTATMDSARNNSDIVQGWIWTSAKQVRTCGVCLGLDGQWFPLSETMASHVSCRCVPTLQTKPWSEILGKSGDDIPETSAQTNENRGWDYYAKLTPAQQNFIVGPGKRRLLEEMKEQGVENPLRTLVGYKDDPKWGPERYEKSLKDLKAAMEGGHLPVVDGIHPNGLKLPGLPEKDFVQTYDAPSGGMVHEEPGYSPSKEGKEREIAANLADQGETVWLQKESTVEGVKSPEGFIQENGRAVSVEFKRLSESAVNVNGAIRSSIRGANKQAQTAVLLIDRLSVNEPQIVEYTKNALARYSARLSKVIIMRKDGTIIEVITNGTS